MSTGDFSVSPAMLSLVGNGVLHDDTTRTQFPSVTGRMAVIKAKSTNSGLVSTGGDGVTVAGSNDDTTSGLDLSAGDSETVSLGTGNLNELYLIAASSGNGVTYKVYG